MLSPAFNAVWVKPFSSFLERLTSANMSRTYTSEISFASTPTDSSVVLIPYSYSAEFMARRQNKSIACPFLHDLALAMNLLKIVDEYILPQRDGNIQKSAVELFLSILVPKIEWIEQRQRDDTALVREILAFIQANYTNDVSRHTIAHALGYTEAHVSRVFHRYLQKGISQHVNELRLLHVEQSLHQNPQQSVLSALYEAGFKSQQTYYRVKSKETAKLTLR